jgi:hypothetical protein
MSTSTTTSGTSEVPVKIFERFLEELTAAGMSGDLVARLRNTLLVDRIFSERALKTAIFGEDQSE